MTTRTTKTGPASSSSSSSSSVFAGFVTCGAACAAAAATFGTPTARAASSSDASSSGGKQRRRVEKNARGDKEGGVNALATALAGGVAGATARVFVAPLDVVKIRLQVQLEGAGSGKYRGLAQAARTILREEGARGLWAGTVPALFLWVPYTAIQFTVLSKFNEEAERRGLFRARSHGEKSAVGAFVGGAVAGSVATVATYPFDVIRTLLASQGHPKVYRNVLDAAVGVARDRGVAKGLYAGVSVTLAEIVPASAVQFGSYATLKKSFGSESVFAQNDFACGFAAGTIARLVIHPLDVVKKRFQVSGFSRSLAYGQRVDAHAYRNFLAAVRTIAKTEGVAGFYKGLFPSLVKSAPASAVTFAVFEALMRMSVKEDDDDA